MVDDSTGEVMELTVPESIIGTVERQLLDKGFEVTQIKVEVIAMPLPKKKA
jgi:hypothetical protein